ncbi:hypothetical protein [Streptosporangium sp. NPDC049376]|uniref:hypothetical protein n=1 Tax=Streptosporangium sp. NPDC049376 TaxID=3366192 RepID=UPI0037B2A456
MKASEFGAVKQRVMRESFPSAGHDLDGMMVDFDIYLRQSPLMKKVRVRGTDDPGGLVVATCRSASGRSAEEIAAELERIWHEDLKYCHFDAHTLTLGDGEVRLNGVTQISPDGFYVTAAIVVTMSRRPARIGG